MNIKRMQRIKQRVLYESKGFLSIVLFNTNKHTYTIGDMISLISATIILCCIVFVSLVVGIK